METYGNGGGGDNNTIGTQVAYGYCVLQNLKLVQEEQVIILLELMLSLDRC